MPASRKRATFVACALVGIGRSRREFVRRAVNVRVLVLVEIFKPINDRPRLLRRRRVVEPDQRTAVDRFVEDWEVAADRVDVEALVRRNVGSYNRRAATWDTDATCGRREFVEK